MKPSNERSKYLAYICKYNPLCEGLSLIILQIILDRSDLQSLVCAPVDRGLNLNTYSTQTNGIPSKETNWRTLMGAHQEKNYVKDAINVLVMDIFLIVMIVGSIIYSSADHSSEDHAPAEKAPASESAH